ncbi:hypothetical protein [Paracoccus ravus]|uniref:hypothetical protein n=1 Tax=Paracoccus ravus TaxID=2447760 RepID=UPI001FD67204|nr:hypothetical protein [Paracoccus ravus]
MPADFAAALGQAVADFGWLEEIIKRTIFALDKARLAEDLTERQRQGWMARMGNIADDSLGTLIEQMDSAMRRHPGLGERDLITDRLYEIRSHRNLLCHASWRPTPDPSRWHPAFVDAKGGIYRQDLTVEDVQQISRITVETAYRVLHVMQATGVQGYWAGDEES